jgi:hypothetical protein
LKPVFFSLQILMKTRIILMGLSLVPLLGCQTPPPSPAPVWPNITQGTVTNNTLTLDKGKVITVSGDLVIETEFDLIIDGDILFPPRSGPFNLKLISRKAKVVIGVDSKIGGGMATTAPGGTIFISGVLLDIQGKIIGQAGGTPSSQWAANQTSRIGAVGHRGGDVILEGVDGIKLGSKTNQAAFVEAGCGGKGESVVLMDSGNTYSRGGNGALGADVIFQVRPSSGPAKVTVFLDGDTMGGRGGDGGLAFASSAGANQGGTAEAQGGNGEEGGTVLFPSAIVIGPAPGMDPRHGNGGWGGRAIAIGGDGADAALTTSAQPGGAARAKGGDGARPGLPPSIPLFNGTIMNGQIGTPGSGEQGDATSGAGGDGFVPLIGMGAANGSASAIGGKNGKNVTPAAVPAAGGAAAPGIKGTPSANVRAPGQP